MQMTMLEHSSLEPPGLPAAGAPVEVPDPVRRRAAGAVVADRAADLARHRRRSSSRSPTTIADGRSFFDDDPRPRWPTSVFANATSPASTAWDQYPLVAAAAGGVGSRRHLRHVMRARHLRVRRGRGRRPSATGLDRGLVGADRRQRPRAAEDDQPLRARAGPDQPPVPVTVHGVSRLTRPRTRRSRSWPTSRTACSAPTSRSPRARIEYADAAHLPPEHPDDQRRGQLLFHVRVLDAV